jgi:TetR/AcrR family transcriptional repressor of nem operon
MSRPALRDKILDAAVQALHERGYNGCGVQDITDAAGVPKGSFYNHFESKETLGAEVLDRYWQNRGCVALRVLSDETLSPIHRLRRYFTALAQGRASSNYRCGCLIGNMSAELSDQSRLVRDRLSSVLAGWTRALETCIREAQCDTAHPGGEGRLGPGAFSNRGVRHPHKLTGEPQGRQDDRPSRRHPMPRNTPILPRKRHRA